MSRQKQIFRGLAACFAAVCLFVVPAQHAQEAAPDPTSAADTAPVAAAPVTPDPPDDAAVEQRTVGGEIVAKIKEAREIGVVLLLLSVLGVGFVVERAVNLRRSTVCPDGLAQNVLGHLKAGRLDQAKADCDAKPSAMANVLASVVRHHRFSFADLNLIAGDIASREVQSHVQRCYPIAIVATVAPLLGLLGTVIGMIEAFEKVALMGEMGDPSVMASAISFALVTTAMGLIIAAPALALYRVFRMRTTMLSTRMDEQVSEVISAWQEHRIEIEEAKKQPVASTAEAEAEAKTEAKGAAS